MINVQEDLVQMRIGRKPVFPLELEDQLVLYYKEMERSSYGLTLKDLRWVAFQLVIRNNSIHFPFGQKQQGPSSCTAF